MSNHELKKQLQLAIVGICIVAITGGLGRFAYTPIIPYMQSSLSLTSTDIGIIASSNYFGYLIGSMIPLFFAFENRQKLTLYLSVIISILSLGLMGFTEDLNHFIVLRFFQGVSGAVALVIATNLIFSEMTEGQSFDLRLAHISGFGVGMFLSAMLIWICSLYSLDWYQQWFVVSVTCVILTIPILILEPNSKTSPKITTSYGKNNMSIGFIGISIGYFFFGLGYIIFGTFIAAMAVNTPALANIQHTTWILVGLAAMPAIFFWQKVSKFTGNHISLSLSCFTTSFGIFLLYFFDSPISSLIACMAYGLGVVGIVGLVLLEGKIRHSGSVKFAVAFLTTTFSIGQISGPYISGIMIDFFGDYKNAMLLSGSALSIAGFCMINYKALLSSRL